MVKVLDGILTRWYPNGNKWSEGEIDDGEMVGKWTYWYENGNKEEEGNLGGEIEYWTYWYENGNKKSEGLLRLKNSLMTLRFPEHRKIWTYYREDGTKREEFDHENDRIVKYYKKE